jgi:hypothetical protein
MQGKNPIDILIRTMEFARFTVILTATLTATLTAFVSCLGRDTFLQLIIPVTIIYMGEFEGLIWYHEASYHTADTLY